MSEITDKDSMKNLFTFLITAVFFLQPLFAKEYKAPKLKISGWHKKTHVIKKAKTLHETSYKLYEGPSQSRGVASEKWSKRDYREPSSYTPAQQEVYPKAWKYEPQKDPQFN